MITTELKDKVLDYIIQNEKDAAVTINASSLATQLQSDASYVNLILNDMSKNNLVELMEISNRRYRVLLQAKAYDFSRRGGYIFEEAILGTELEKLQLEIRSLQSSLTADKYGMIMSTVSNILVAVGLFKK